MSIELSQDIAELLKEYLNNGASKAHKELLGYLIDEYRNEFIHANTWKELKEMLKVEIASRDSNTHDLKAMNKFYQSLIRIFNNKYPIFIQAI
jgi:hypothetical protein